MNKKIIYNNLSFGTEIGAFRFILNSAPVDFKKGKASCLTYRQWGHFFVSIGT